MEYCDYAVGEEELADREHSAAVMARKPEMALDELRSEDRKFFTSWEVYCKILSEAVTDGFKLDVRRSYIENDCTGNIVDGPSRTQDYIAEILENTDYVESFESSVGSSSERLFSYHEE